MIGSSKKNAPEPAPTTPKPQPAPSAPAKSEFNALLGKGSEFEGKLSFEGTVRIDGIMKGEVRSKDKLVVGDGAKVEAEVEVGSAVISGDVIGNITAKERIELKAPAKIKGNITTPVIIIEEGVSFDGNCSMAGGSSSSKPSTPPSSDSST